MYIHVCILYFREGAVKVRFNLTFRGDLDGLKFDIPSIIDSKTNKKEGVDYLALFLKDFLVDVRSKTGIQPTTTRPINPEGTSRFLYSVMNL